jgi:glycosyltransferase involved in cell wall biosynthesis
VNLVIVHYHLRPGGVRRIIERATPHLIRAFHGALDRVVLACGEARDREWIEEFGRRLAPVPVECVVEAAIGYFSEQRKPVGYVTRRIRAALGGILSGAPADEALVWAHNLGVGRNVLLSRELTRLCVERAVPLIAHHHDWWFDNRWSRWREMRRCGCATLRATAAAVFPAVPGVQHVAINGADAAILRRCFSTGAAWLPNLADSKRPTGDRVSAARRWLKRELENAEPVWIMPCRLLRRKNVAEALLLTRWLRPEAWLVTTGGVSSADERAYADRLAAGAERHGWQLRLGVLEGSGIGRPAVAELLAASEAVLLTSVQEGFGLSYLEAAAARRPLIARAIPNVAPDLARFGFRFPQHYNELLIDPRLFDWKAETDRQRRLFARWKGQLPGPCQRWTGRPEVLGHRAGPGPIPFSRLTLSAQLEVLAQPLARSWDLCAPLNRFLPGWRRRAGSGGLRITPWPRSAARWLSGGAYAQRFARLARGLPRTAPRPGAGPAAQAEFIRARLGSEHLFPLLWRSET